MPAAEVEMTGAESAESEGRDSPMKCTISATSPFELLPVTNTTVLTERSLDSKARWRKIGYSYNSASTGDWTDPSIQRGLESGLPKIVHVKGDGGGIDVSLARGNKNELLGNGVIPNLLQRGSSNQELFLMNSKSVLKKTKCLQLTSRNVSKEAHDCGYHSWLKNLVVKCLN